MTSNPSPLSETARALDAQVAEEIFGYTWQPLAPDDFAGHDVTHVLQGAWRGSGEIQSCHRIAERRSDGHIRYFQNAPFSTDYTAVRLVEDEIERRGLISQYVECLFNVAFEEARRYRGRTLMLVRATAEQRCRAALSVVRSAGA